MYDAIVTDFKNTHAYIVFCITAENFEPNEITQLLQITPSYTHKKGDKGKYSGKELQCASWEIHTKSEEVYDLGIQLDELLQMLKDKSEVLSEIKKIYLECSFKFSVVVYTRNGFLPGIYLNRSQLELINLIQAEIEYDVYL